MICDGWSVHLLVREIGALYGAFTAGPPVPSGQAARAVRRLRGLAARGGGGDVGMTELAWWLNLLSGEIARWTCPPTGPGRPSRPTAVGGPRGSSLPDLTGRLTGSAGPEGATLFMTLLAAIQALLHRHSGQDDILVGAPVAGRRAVETEELIGCFLNTLVLRTGFGGQPGFRGLVDQVREVTLGAYSHQDVPFEAVLAALPVQRDLSRTPLFQVMVNLLNLPAGGEMRLPGLEVDAEQLACRRPRSPSST